MRQTTMKILQGKRCSGKTTTLIIESNSSGLPIITATKLSANYVAKMASEMKIDIPKPICILEALARGRVVGDCLIDELESCLHVIGLRPHLVTTTIYENEGNN